MPKRQQQEKRSYGEDHGRPDESSGPEASTDIPNIKREFILTPSTDDTLQDVVRLFSRATGTNLTNSHFLRVLLKSVAHAMPKLEEEVARIGRLKRPSNARASQAEREEYERTLAAVVVAALQSSRPFEVGLSDKRKGKGPGKRSA